MQSLIINLPNGAEVEFFSSEQQTEIDHIFAEISEDMKLWQNLANRFKRQRQKAKKQARKAKKLARKTTRKH